MPMLDTPDYASLHQTPGRQVIHSAPSNKDIFDTQGRTVRQRRRTPTSPLVEDILDKSFSSFIGASNERTASTVEETHIERSLPPHLEHSRRDVFMDFHVPLRRPHVLSKSHHIDVDFPQFCKSQSQYHPQ